MKNLTFLLSFVFLFVLKSHGQTYGNEWINFSQKYYSFDVYQTGIHKIDYATLQASGIPLATFSTPNIQIFGREKEIPIHIEDGGDLTMNPGDYILFYGEINDSWLDTTLYESSDDVGNVKYSLYNDTIQYFFTWNSSISNLRYTVESDVNFAAYTPSEFLLYEIFQSNHDYYNEGEKGRRSARSCGPGPGPRRPRPGRRRRP